LKTWTPKRGLPWSGGRYLLALTDFTNGMQKKGKGQNRNYKLIRDATFGYAMHHNKWQKLAGFANTYHRS